MKSTEELPRQPPLLGIRGSVRASQAGAAGAGNARRLSNMSYEMMDRAQQIERAEAAKQNSVLPSKG